MVSKDCLPRGNRSGLVHYEPVCFAPLMANNAKAKVKNYIARVVINRDAGHFDMGI